MTRTFTDDGFPIVSFTLLQGQSLQCSSCGPVPTTANDNVFQCWKCSGIGFAFKGNRTTEPVRVAPEPRKVKA